MTRSLHAYITPARRVEHGLTLIELMVALAIGSFLMIGAITVFIQSRTTFRVTESVSRLQENARFVLDALEPDLRMASYWGLTSRPYLIVGRAGADEPAGIGAPSCENNWTIDLENPVAGTNGNAVWPWAGCLPQWGLAARNTVADTLVVRRVEVDSDPPPLDAGTLYIQSFRGTPGRLFVGATVPAGFDPDTSALHQVVVNGYYVSNRSSFDATVPSLRVKRLRDAQAIVDEEVLPGVEDLQIQFGVDTDDEGQAFRKSIDRYVNPDDPILDPDAVDYLPFAKILAVRVWLRVRAEREERGYTDTATYVYADQNVGPFNDAFRRLVVSKTIYLRNTLPAS